MKKLIILLVMLILMPGVFAQEGQVCVVYFTSNACGNECRLTDSFMEGLENEYHDELTSITYYVDVSQENTNIFKAYSQNYGFPEGVPLVLFGKGEYFYGKNSIYDNTEQKIFYYINRNGTNCPLESGYVPPSGLDPGGLPGDADVSISQGITDSEEDEDDNGFGGEPTNGDGTTPEVFEDLLPKVNPETGEIEIPFWMIIAIILIVIIVIIGLVFGRGRRPKSLSEKVKIEPK